jgi:hypothetical protein
MLTRRHEGFGSALQFLGQSLLIVDAGQQEHRVLKAQMAKDEELPVSLMPPTFGSMLSEAEFSDLIGWLLQH